MSEDRAPLQSALWPALPLNRLLFMLYEHDGWSPSSAAGQQLLRAVFSVVPDTKIIEARLLRRTRQGSCPQVQLATFGALFGRRRVDPLLGAVAGLWGAPSRTPTSISATSSEPPATASRLGAKVRRSSDGTSSACLGPSSVGSVVSRQCTPLAAMMLTSDSAPLAPAVPRSTLQSI